MKFDTKLIPFTTEHVLDRALILRMLKFEDNYGRTTGQEIYKVYTSHNLEPGYAINRKVLSHFGFTTTLKDVETYRGIFSAYYNSPTNYDEEVLNSVYYMKNNKCVFYTKDKLTINDTIRDCNLLTTIGNDVTLFDAIDRYRPFNQIFLCAFSMS
jgi:hypothetical protein